MALGPGSIAFTGYSAGSSGSGLSFVALADISVGTVIYFNDNEWRGAGFNSGESVWSWRATGDVAAGTIVTMDMFNPTAPTSNLGDIAVLSPNGVSFGGTEIVYAYVGQPDAPETFLSAMASRSFEGLSWDPATLTGTGLTAGQNAVALGGVDIAVYDGARLGSGSFADYLPLINDPANWVYQSSGGDLGEDGIAPDLPFSPAGFSDDPNVQVVNFSADSLAVSQAEGDSGETILTFTVERSADTAGTVGFSGTIDVKGTTRSDDFGGTAPVIFTGTIEAGQTSGTVTVRVSGDVVFEQGEDFTLSLQTVSNDGANAVLGEDTVATGTIANDDPAPASIAFVGYNAEGMDNLNFLAVSDIAAGTVIHFTDNAWTGSSFNSGESMWSWTTDSEIPAGTIITMDGLNSAAVSSSHGSISFTSGTAADLDEYNSSEIVYAYLGTPEEPSAFLTAISTASSFGAALDGTGLIAGVNVLSLSPAGMDIASYNGPRTGFTSYEDYLPHIHNPANWIGQNTSADNTADGILPDLPLQALPFSTDPTVQVVQFAAGSLGVTQPEGNSGDTAFTFTVERTNGTEGDLAFTVRVPVGTYPSATNAADFGGGTLPVVSGTIPAGESSTAVTTLVKGEHLYEVNERFLLMLESASNPDASSVVIGNNSVVAGTINNDDDIPDTILDGDTHTATIVVTGQDHLVIEQGGAVLVQSGSAISWSGTNTDVVIDNAGLIGGSITTARSTTGTLTISNLETGVIRGVLEVENVGSDAAVTLNNAGLIELNDRIDFRDAADVGTVVIHNLAGGVILQNSGGDDIMRPGANGVVNNHGSIMHAAGFAGGGDGVDYQGDPGVVNNYAGGVIEASRHAVTGDASVQVLNEGTMIGRNGSAVNIDNNGTEAERAFVTNHGRMEGRSANLADSDGDAVDIDGLLTLENYGFIGGMGHNGYHDGEPNVSEGVAIGGGTITNYAGGEIYGYGRAIQVDNSSNANALGTTTIVNHGLIRGDGNGPTGVTPEEQALFAERIRGGEAINLLGTYADLLTNTGLIVGGVRMGGGDDALVNSGTMTATGGSAVDLGDGDDTFEHHAGSTVTGLIDGGEGTDTLELIGPGIGSLGANANFENLEVQSGMWTLQSDAYDQVDIAAGAMVMSQLRLADQGEMTVATGGTVLITNGSDAVIAEGSADIENAGLIQALGMQGATPARAIVTNGGDIHNMAGGIILAQGAAIASGAAAAAGVDIVNESMIQSLSGQAIVLVGDQDDSVTNRGVIAGSVDLGAGDDTLNISTSSSITGGLLGGDGDDTVNLSGAGAGSLGASTGFENLVVQEGSWSVTDGAVNFSDITVEDGATLNTRLTLNDGDRLTVELGGTIDLVGGNNVPPITVLGPANGVMIDNSGLITGHAATRTIQGTFAAGESYEMTIWNRESGVMTHASAATVIQLEGGQPVQGAPVSGPLTLHNAGQILGGDGYVIAAHNFRGEFILNNYATGLIESGPGGEAYRGGGTINNWGTMRSGMDPNEPNSYDGDGINFRSRSDIVVNNYGGGVIEGGHHAVTGETGATILNDTGGVMIGHNGSAVNVDNGGSEAEKVFITNRGTMEGRSAELDDSDGDAVDVDGLVQVLNYGRIAGLGAEGYHNGEPNVSEGIAIGGGTIVNNATGEIYGYGRGIQVDNSSNENALGATTIVNDGLIQGDGHGPEGVDPADAARFDLRGNEAINLIGAYEDWVINTSTGRIVGGISMGGGRDTLNNSGSITATGGSAIDMGAGNDQLNLYVGSTVTGTILLGAGDDVANSTSAAAYVIDGGDGNDSIAMYYTIFGGDDVLFGGAGNDHISGGLGEDRIDGGLDNDSLYGEDGDDLIEGGAGDDTIDGGNDDDVLFGDAGNDTMTGGLGNDVAKGNAGDDTFVVLASADGRDSYDGGDGIDTLDYSAVTTAVNLTLRAGVTTYQTDTIESIENVIGGAADDRLIGNAFDNVLTGNAGGDALRGLAGNDTLVGGNGDDTLDGGVGNDLLLGGGGADELVGGNGDDELQGGADNDVLNGGAGNDILEGGEGNDTLTGGAGVDTFVFKSLSDGIDTITDFRVNGAQQDQLVLSATMFENFSGDDAFDLIGSGYLRAVAGSGTTEIQIDLDGGGDAFVTLANLNGNISNGILADHVLVQQDLIV